MIINVVCLRRWQRDKFDRNWSLKHESSFQECSRNTVFGRTKYYIPLLNWCWCCYDIENWHLSASHPADGCALQSLYKADRCKKSIHRQQSVHPCKDCTPENPHLHLKSLKYSKICPWCESFMLRIKNILVMLRWTGPNMITCSILLILHGTDKCL